MTECVPGVTVLVKTPSWVEIVKNVEEMGKDDTYALENDQAYRAARHTGCGAHDRCGLCRLLVHHEGVGATVTVSDYFLFLLNVVLLVLIPLHVATKTPQSELVWCLWFVGWTLQLLGVAVFIHNLVER